ncbi:CRISPR-associated endonuclease Cas1 [bacterium]|nr:MAG: CRISPR-associated endonuclease Cas1 [bacterium]
MGESIYLAGFGVSLRVKKNSFLIFADGNKDTISASKVQKIVFLGSGKGVSIDAIRLAIKYRIPVFFAYSNGYPYAMLFPVVAVGTVKTRRAQYEAYNCDIGVELVLGILKGKLRNQANLIRFFWKSRKRTAPDLANRLKENAEAIKYLIAQLESIGSDRIDSDFRRKVMNIEARAAEMHYWPSFSLLLPTGFSFEKRVKPNAKDPVNALLNLGYGLLFMEVVKEVIYGGLDPYAGFLHADRSGRESLVLDLMEEFRQWCVDRLIIKLLSIRKLRPEEIMDGPKIRREIVGMFCKEFEDMMGSVFVNTYGEKRTMRGHISAQVLRVKRHLLEKEKYRPCIFMW